MVGRTIQSVNSHETPPSARQQQHAKLSGDPHVRLLLYQQRPRSRRYLESALQLTRTDVNSVRPNDAPRQVIPINASSEAADESRGLPQSTEGANGALSTKTSWSICKLYASNGLCKESNKNCSSASPSVRAPRYSDQGEMRTSNCKRLLSR